MGSQARGADALIRSMQGKRMTGRVSGTRIVIERSRIGTTFLALVVAFVVGAPGCGEGNGLLTDGGAGVTGGGHAGGSGGGNGGGGAASGGGRIGGGGRGGNGGGGMAGAGSGGTGGQCPPCVAPPDPSCRGTGICGCGPYVCPADAAVAGDAARDGAAHDGPGVACGSAVCDPGLECCNALRGICAPPGVACTQ